MPNRGIDKYPHSAEGVIQLAETGINAVTKSVGGIGKLGIGLAKIALKKKGLLDEEGEGGEEGNGEEGGEEKAPETTEETKPVEETTKPVKKTPKPKGPRKSPMKDALERIEKRLEDIHGKIDPKTGQHPGVIQENANNHQASIEQQLVNNRTRTTNRVRNQTKNRFFQE
jgi:hypothetical protein